MNNKNIKLVMFTSEFCIPCKRIKSFLPPKEVSFSRGLNVEVEILDFGKDGEDPRWNQPPVVKAAPTFKLYKDGQLIACINQAFNNLSALEEWVLDSLDY